MKKLVISAVLAFSPSLLGCQIFTASETVAEPDQGKARALRTAIENDRASHAKHSAHEHAEGASANPHAEVAAKQAPPPVPVVKETATASHILISYAGARGGHATRTKEQAQKLAEEVAKKAQARTAKFAELAKRYTEDPSGTSNGGQLGTFERGRMVPEFDKATFALAPGQTSGVVETAFGFHIIHRDK